MLTARDTTDDTLQGFEEGADDYLVKPFNLKILEARVKALVRRTSPGAFSDALVFEDLALDLGNHTVRRGDQGIPFKNAFLPIGKGSKISIIRNLAQERGNRQLRKSEANQRWSLSCLR